MRYFSIALVPVVLTGLLCAAPDQAPTKQKVADAPVKQKVAEPPAKQAVEPVQAPVQVVPEPIRRMPTPNDGGPKGKEPVKEKRGPVKIVGAEVERAAPAETVAVPVALAEVNAMRAARGLYPYVEDPLLTMGAQQAATLRANALWEGHTTNDFNCLPNGASARAAGCGACPQGTFAACCMFDRGPRFAGAAYVIGRDGRKYCQLFIRD